ncbi:Pleckstrin-like domain-containing protein, partial [Globisporangium splendens]
MDADDGAHRRRIKSSSSDSSSSRAAPAVPNGSNTLLEPRHHKSLSPRTFVQTPPLPARRSAQSDPNSGLSHRSSDADSEHHFAIRPRELDMRNDEELRDALMQQENQPDDDSNGRGTAFATAIQMSPRQHAQLVLGQEDAYDVTIDDLDSSFNSDASNQEQGDTVAASATMDHDSADRKRSTSDQASSSTPALPRRNSLMNSFRFSWHNVLGQSSSDSARLSVVNPESGADPATNEKHNPDMSVRAQDNEMGVVMQGWLEKCGQQFKTWNWRFFVLRDDGVLSYYVDEHMKKLKGSINVGYGSRADISVQSNLTEKKFVFMIASPQRNTMISAPSQRMMTKWIAKLHSAGATPSEPWDPLKKTVKFFVRDSECPHEWKRYDDPTSYIHMEGCLLKRGHVNKNWKNRFFRIEKGELRYYTENQEELKGSVKLKGTIVSPGMAQCSDGRKYYFVLTSKDGKFEMHLNAHTETSMHRWIEAIQEAQTALGKKVGAKETVSGLALVVKRAEEIPLANVDVLFNRPEEIEVELERRTEALIVTKTPKDGIPVGSQLIAIDGRSILRETCTESRALLRASTFPLKLEFVLPPYKKGMLVKKSRSGFENWKKRVLIVTNGEVHYYKQVTSGKTTTLKHRKSFSLYGCYLNLVQFPARPLCIVVARSPSDKLVLQTSTEEERIEWASVLYCSIRMVSQGITSGHIENLNLEKTRPLSETVTSDIRGGSFNAENRTEF